MKHVKKNCFQATSQLAFYVNLHRAVIGPSATLTGRWRPDIDLRRMLTGLLYGWFGVFNPFQHYLSHNSRVDPKTVASQMVVFPQYLISSPWRHYEDYNISFCKRWKFRCHCSYEQWHFNFIFYKGVKVAPKQDIFELLQSCTQPSILRQYLPYGFCIVCHHFYHRNKIKVFGVIKPNY